MESVRIDGFIPFEPSVAEECVKRLEDFVRQINKVVKAFVSSRMLRCSGIGTGKDLKGRCLMMKDDMKDHTKNHMVRGNLDLLSEFMRYAFDHPDILDEIPPDAEVVLLPEGDSALCVENMRVLERDDGSKRPYVVFRMEKPKTVPPRLERVVGSV